MRAQPTLTYFERSCEILRAAGETKGLAHALANQGELYCRAAAWKWRSAAVTS